MCAKIISPNSIHLFIAHIKFLLDTSISLIHVFVEEKNINIEGNWKGSHAFYAQKCVEMIIFNQKYQTSQSKKHIYVFLMWKVYNIL